MILLSLDEVDRVKRLITSAQFQDLNLKLAFPAKRGAPHLSLESPP